MSHQRGSWKIRLLLLVAAVVSACGGGDICLQCPDGTPTPGQSGAIVTGNIVSTNPQTSPASITVIVCVGLEPNQSITSCPNSFYTTATSEGDFTRRNVIAGAETIFFWVDANNDGTIDMDDPQATLIDTEGSLDDIRSGQTVTIANTRIDFVNQTATATITVGLTPTPTPTAVTTTPTPANT